MPESAGRDFVSHHRPLARAGHISDRSRLTHVSRPVTRAARPGFEMLTVPKPVKAHPDKPKPASPLPKNISAFDIIKPQPYAQPGLPKQQQSRVLKRQFVAPKSAVSTQASDKKSRHKRSRSQVVLIGMALVIFALGLLINVQTIQTNHDAKSQVAALTQKTDNSDNTSTPPSETKPPSGSFGSYQVAANLPKYLKIPKLGTSARVIPLGVTTSNELKAPTNIYDTGWYEASAHPGDAASLGAVLIDGHVHGPTLPGVFANIKKLVADDTIQIVRGDNQVFTYKVVKVQNYDATTIDMGMMLTSIQPGQPGLNLITCGGPFDRKTGEYTQRTAVFAVQL